MPGEPTTASDPWGSPVLAHALLDLGATMQLPQGVLAPLETALAPDEHGWIPAEIEDRFWQDVAALPEARDFAVDAARAARPGAFGAVELAAMTAPDVRGALASLSAASDVLHDDAIFDLAERADGSAALVHRAAHDARTDGGALARETALAVAVELIHRSTGERDASPREAYLAAPMHTRRRALEQALGCEIHEGAAVDRLELGADVLALPIRTADARMHRLARRLVDLERARAADTRLAIAARHALQRIVLSGGAPLEQLATQLGLAPRTLQARLSRERAHVRVLIDQARRQAADRLLLSGLRPIDVRRGLGYADLASFRRACRRWWGAGPQERARQLRQ